MGQPTVTMNAREHIEERLKAYIHPNAAQTAEQREAFDRAVAAQLAHEAAQDVGELPGNVQSLTIGSYSVTMSEPTGGAYTRATICPAAWAILFNAGLLQRALPVAKRL